MSPLRTVLLFALLIVVLAAIVVGWRKGSAPAVFETPIATYPALPASCRNLAFEGDDFIVCAADPATQRIAVAHLDRSGLPLKSLEALADQMQFDFAMNAGMYHEDNSPVGLYVENGHEFALLNTDDADGNFFMKPNGVFFVDRSGKPGVLETSAFAIANPQVESATQSGPMLVIDGNIHPRFEPDGASRYIRNGVGLDDAGRAVFAISRSPVSLGKFARLFRDALGCKNALFFDGAISALHDGKRYLVGGGYPAGPMVAVQAKVPSTAQ